MKYKKWLILGCLLLDTVFISGCHIQGNERSNNQETSQQETGMKQKEISKGVLESFEEVLSYYPTSNIEDLIDKEKGKQLIIRTDVSKEKDTKDSTPLISSGMVLYINTSTGKGHGYYSIEKYYNDPEKKEEDKKYLVAYDKGIHLKNSTGNQELDKKIENFKFLFQYADFGDLSKKKLVSAEYNPEVPIFSAEYQLSNGDSLVKKLRKDCDFGQDEAPVLVLNGRGNYEGPEINNFDYRHIDIYFSKKPTNSISSGIVYTDDITEEGDY